ncbi:folylpolyglutamate synthase/dihydrofolate synthase family protein [Clostridium sp. HMP27]|uniref:bifunctional folylpolyglutamate synthase/dihydrofolate synthase n=1 Tax=Clostridium sp. HMP27 TaxID=1487921 RepID=UPI00052BDB1C|nr:folylpolyglutamate synthase/dihydrofolate synthase family protein [Clostridium sp. HMP27]KGK88918.1 folylpolyglutamate synthase [Clostridium sp. HMP27]
MNYNESIGYIENTAKFGKNKGLERTNKILELLGNPHKDLKCIHIAGTNGKGSTTAMLTQILIESGYKVGMYTSPFIEEFEERIQINSNNIPKERLCEVVEKVKIAVDKTCELGYDEPTEFEIITAVMFVYFQEEKVDYAVIEVGLGGRIDATNVVNPLISIITSISYDHVKILGNTLEEIAYEKAGIIKEKTPVILYPVEEEAKLSIEKVAKEKQSPIIYVKKEDSMLKEKLYNVPYQEIIINTSKNTYEIQLSLLGTHQLLNCSVVIKAAEELQNIGVNIKKEHIIEGLKKVKWAGRLEMLKAKPMVVIDGAHNIDGIKSLKNSINTYFKYNKFILIMGILSDKQVDDMVKVITPEASNIITVTPPSYRAENSSGLVEIIKKYNSNCEAIENYKEAYEKALSYANANDLILICGSLYMVGEMRKTIRTINS